MPLPMMTSFSVMVRSAPLFGGVGKSCGFGSRRALDPADGEVHPQEAGNDDQKEQHEAARPDAGEVVQRAECDRQDEAAKPTDHAHKTADGADALRVIDRDVLVDRGLAEAHEEAEHEGDDDEGERADLEMEG